jgi:hypothetical protein
LNAGCPEEITLQARVTNQGSLGVPAGVVVSFFLGATAPGTTLGTSHTANALLPGQSEVVDMVVPIRGQTPPWASSAASNCPTCLSEWRR